jgi:hypothetical protein
VRTVFSSAKKTIFTPKRAVNNALNAFTLTHHVLRGDVPRARARTNFNLDPFVMFMTRETGRQISAIIS